MSQDNLFSLHLPSRIEKLWADLDTWDLFPPVCPYKSTDNGDGAVTLRDVNGRFIGWMNKNDYEQLIEGPTRKTAALSVVLG